MSKVQTSTFTESALSDKVKEFLTRFKDKSGSYKYVEQIDEMMPDGRLRVYRTLDAGASWKPLTRGLPQKDAWETVLRDGLATDTAKPAGIYFGTRSGKLFASGNEGGSWECLADGLPPVTCVRAAVVRGTAASAPRTRPSARRQRAQRPRARRSR